MSDGKDPNQLFRIGPVFNEDVIKAARETFNPGAILAGIYAQHGESKPLAATIGEAIQTALTQAMEGYQFNAAAQIAGAMADAQARAGIAAQAHAALAASEAVRGQAESIGRAVYNWILGIGKDELCREQREQEKVQELGAIG